MEKRPNHRLWIGLVVLLASLLAGTGFWWFSPAQQQHRRNRALFAACTDGDVKAVQDALTAGASVNARDGTGITPLMYAARGNRPNMSDPEATDHPDIVQLLLKNGAEVNATTATGFVALFWAARYGHEKVVKVLIANKADVKARDKDGFTAMRWAHTNRATSPPHFDKVIGLLKAAGATE